MPLARASVRSIVWLLSLALAVSGVFSSGAPAFAAPTGKISGTVTGPDAGLLGTVSVTAYRWDSDSGWDEVTDIQPEDGAYSLTGLAPGVYRVGFSDWRQNYVTEYWDDALTVESATDVAVTAGGNATGRDATLTLAGHITGTVRDTGGQPLGSISVSAHRWDADEDQWDRIAVDYTADDGTYDVGGLAAGDYRLEFDDGSGSGYLTEFSGDATSLKTATDIRVTTGTPTSGHDAQLILGGHITGTVTGLGGQHLDNIDVTAWKRVGSAWKYAANSSTDEDGHYDLEWLATGDYRVGFEDWSMDGYLREYWDDAATLGSATDIAVIAGTTTSGKNARLDRGGHLTGTVTGVDDKPLEDVEVTAYRWDSEQDEWDDATSDSTRADGHYDLGGLTTGVYRVTFQDSSDGGYLGERLDDVAVTVGTTTSGQDVQLSRGGQITGSVTGDEGQPLDGISVFAYRREAGRWTWATSTSTGTDGHYDVGGLATGDYRLQFYDDVDSGYLTEYWDDAPTLGAASSIAVTAGETTSGKDAGLTLGGRIAGTVTGPGGAASDAEVTVYRPDGDGWKPTGSGYTDAAGKYDVTGLPGGTYRLQFSDYSGQGLLTATSDLEVTEGETATANAELAMGGRISGLVTGPDHKPVEYADVTAYSLGTDGWEEAGDTYTEEDGSYTIVGLASGSYRLQFSPGRQYATEYWNDAPTLDAATSIVVTAGATVTGKDAQMATRTGGRIIGHVTGVNDEPLEYAQIAVYRLDGETWRYEAGRSTDWDGRYVVDGLRDGTYRLAFSDASDEQVYAPEFWEDALSLSAADDVEVTGGATTRGVDVQLALAGRIIGHVTDVDDRPLNDIEVRAYRWDGTAWTAEGESDWTDAHGRYAFGGLVAGDYRLEFDDTSEEGYPTAYFGGATLDTATSISVSAGSTLKGRDLQLSGSGVPSVANTSLPTISGTPRVGSSLTATSGSWSPSTGLAVTYQWLVGGRAVAGASASTYTPTAADVGKTIRVEVTASAAGHASGKATSKATAAVVAATSPPPVSTAITNATAPTINGTPKVGTTVTATPGAWSPANAAVAYQWLVAGSPVAGAVTSSYTPNASDAGKSLELRVTATLAGYTTATATSAKATVGKGTLMATKKPQVTGKAKKNATLKVTPGTWSPAKVTVTYKWYAGSKAIPKATGAKLKLAGKTLKAVAGKAISVLVTITAPGYNSVPTKLKVSGKVKR